MSQIEKQQLVHEVNLLRKLNHPNIVRYHDRIIDKINSKLYLIMEYCINGDLSKLINLKKKTGGMFAEKFIWKIASQITSALKVCHNKSFNKENKVILHRDIKPANIFLDEEYNVKLGDFGLAKSLPSSLEYALTVAGTPNYMSPEQIKMEPYNNKSDVWSLGCLIYELATLNHPFGGNCAKDLAFCICTARFKPVADTYSIEMKNFVQLLLNPDSQERPSIEQVEKFIDCNYTDMMKTLTSDKIEKDIFKLMEWEKALEARECLLIENEEKMNKKLKKLNIKSARLNNLLKRLNMK